MPQRWRFIKSTGNPNHCPERDRARRGQMLPMKTLKSTRAVTYRRYGIPALILEGKWLTEKYRLAIGDVVDIDYQEDEIRLRKNKTLSLERKKKLKDLQEIKNQAYDNKTGSTETFEGESA